MLAKKKLPTAYIEWNERHGAPHGRGYPFEGVMRSISWRRHLKFRGPFAVQPNSSLRAFEYPWAYHAQPRPPGARVLELGGGLSGFQFVLAREGAKVVNVDPGLGAEGVGWPCDPKTMAYLNRIYGTSVELRNTVAPQADLETAAYDQAYSISVIEHLPDRDIEDAMRHCFRCLKPGGYMVLTVDLFLNLAPFTTRAENEFGRNIDVRRLSSLMPFELASGDRAELYGFPEFDPDRVQSRLEEYLIGTYPALSQCLVLRKPVSADAMTPP